MLISCNLNYIKKHIEGPPGGPVVENPPSRVGNAGLLLGPGTEAPRAMEQLGPLSLHARATGEAPHAPAEAPRSQRNTLFLSILKSMERNVANVLIWFFKITLLLL